MNRTHIISSLLALPLLTTALSADDHFTQAAANGKLVREGYQRCQHYVDGWLASRTHQGPVASLLIPDSLSGNRSKRWSPKDAAADNYAFMVLTTSFTNPEQYQGIMRDILTTERKHASQPDGMPVPYQLDSGGQVAKANLVFEASEYVKDGLLPISEWMGTDNPWFDRMVEIESVMWQNHAKETNAFGKPMVSHNIEVNGEQLQVLSRLYWITGDKKWLEYATCIGEHYLLGKGHHPADNFGYVLNGYYTLYLLDKSKTAYRDAVLKMLGNIQPKYSGNDFGERMDGRADAAEGVMNLFNREPSPSAAVWVDDTIRDMWKQAPAPHTPANRSSKDCLLPSKPGNPSD